MFFYDVNIPSRHGYICQKRFWDDAYVSHMHWHSFIELEFFIVGHGVQHYENKDVPIKPGDIWLFPINGSHQISLDKGTQNINISFDPEILHEKLQKKLSLPHPLHCSLSEEGTREFLAKANVLFYEQEHQEPLSRVKAVSVINDILVDVIRNSSSETITIDNPMILEMVEYLQCNYKDSPSLNKLAKAFSLTPNYCGYIFKKNLGVSYNDYLNLLKLKNACKALLSTNLSIKEIAADSGFASLEYFYTIFKKFYNITPAKYRSLTSTQIATTSFSKFNSV